MTTRAKWKAWRAALRHEPTLRETYEAGYLTALEDAARACEQQASVRSATDEYATGRRLAINDCAAAVRAMGNDK